MDVFQVIVFIAVPFHCCKSGKILDTITFGLAIDLGYGKPRIFSFIHFEFHSDFFPKMLTASLFKVELEIKAIKQLLGHREKKV